MQQFLEGIKRTDDANVPPSQELREKLIIKSDDGLISRALAFWESLASPVHSGKGLVDSEMSSL
jgi:hypothetical protein